MSSSPSPAQSQAVELARGFVEREPFNTSLGLCIARIGDGYAQATLPFEPEGSSYVGSLHAAVQYGLMEAASEAALPSAIPDYLARATPLVLRAEIAYQAAADGDCRADATVRAEDVARARAELAERARTRVDVAVTLFDAAGTVATEATIQWYVRVQGA